MARDEPHASESARRSGLGLDARTLESLFVRLEKPVFNVVYRWLWSTEEARDVTQDAFMKLWTIRSRVALATVEPLLFRIALNLAARRLRSRRLWRWFGLEPLKRRAASEPSAEEQLTLHQRASQIRQAIDGLPPKLKQVVVMCELSGLSYQQVADALEVPVGTVGSRRSLAIAALEKVLGPLEQESRWEAR